GLCAVAWFARGDVAAPTALAPASPHAGTATSGGASDAAATSDEPAAGAKRVAASVDANEPDAAADAIVGIVVDEAGAPVEGAELALDDPPTWVQSGHSDAVGAFAVPRSSADRCSRARLRCRHPAFDELVAWLRWGERARIVLPSRIAVEVTVVDDAGALVAAECVVAAPNDGRIGTTNLERSGATWCGRLRRGCYDVVVNMSSRSRGVPARRVAA